MSITINGTTGISGVDGSSTTPAFQGNDTNTGLFYGTDIVGISTGGSERVRVDANGNVGIGTTNPSPKITVARTATTSVTNASYYLGLGGTENLVDSKRLIGMGYSNGSSEEYPTAMGYVETSNAGYTNGAIAFYTRSVTTNTAPSERMRITSDGSLYFGSTTSSITNGAINFFNPNAINTYISVGHKTGSVSGADFVAAYYNGTQIGGMAQSGTTNVAYNTSSDYRLKEDIQPIVNALDRVSQLKPVTYKWKNTDNELGEGFIAHELQEVCPLAVTGEKDAINEDGSIKPQNVDYSKVVALLSAAIQEQQTIINDLKARVTALETSNV